MGSVRDEIEAIIMSQLELRLQSSILTDRIISLLNKQVQEEGWIMKDWDHMHRTWYERGPTFQEVLKGRARKR